MSADKVFTSVALMGELQRSVFQFTGTVHVNHHKGCDLQNDKHLGKSGHGSFDYRVEPHPNIVSVRQLDTKMVTLVSTCAGGLPVDTVRQWDKTAKEHTDTNKPFIIEEHISHIGGIDLLDTCAARYKFPLKSRRWHIYIYWHFIKLVAINGLLCYRQDCKHHAIPKTVIIRQFQARVASGLVEANTAR